MRGSTVPTGSIKRVCLAVGIVGVLLAPGAAAQAKPRLARAHTSAHIRRTQQLYFGHKVG